MSLKSIVKHYTINSELYTKPMKEEEEKLVQSQDSNTRHIGYRRAPTNFPAL